MRACRRPAAAAAVTSGPPPTARAPMRTAQSMDNKAPTIHTSTSSRVSHTGITDRAKEERYKSRIKFAVAHSSLQTTLVTSLSGSRSLRSDSSMAAVVESVQPTVSSHQLLAHELWICY